jgi:hypothetical protein
MRAVGSVEVDQTESDVDLTFLCLRMAEGFRHRGAAHPVAAAVALAARGTTGLDRAAFAERFGRKEDGVEAVEAGAVAFEELPGEVGDLLEASGRFDLLQLADLDRAFRRTPVDVVVDLHVEGVWIQGRLAGMAACVGVPARL